MFVEDCIGRETQDGSRLRISPKDGSSLNEPSVLTLMNGMEINIATNASPPNFISSKRRTK